MKYKKMLKELDNGKTISRKLWDNGKTIKINKDDQTLLDVGKIGELHTEDKRIVQLENFNTFILSLPENLETPKFKVHNTEIHTIEKCTLESLDDGIDDWFIV